MGQRHHHAERPPVAEPRQIEQFSARVKHHLLVEVDLVGARDRPRLQHGIHRVIPVGPLVRTGPVRGPAEIGRVDVGGDPLLEPVQLIRPDEMHLAGQDRAVAGEAQMVGEGGRIGGQRARVVEHPGPARQQPGHEGGARGTAERAVGVSAIEPHALGAQPVEVRRAGDAVAPRGEAARGHLIGDDDEEVRLLDGGVHRRTVPCCRRQSIGPHPACHVVMMCLLCRYNLLRCGDAGRSQKMG